MSLTKKPGKDIHVEIERRWILRNLPNEAMKESVLSIEQYYDVTDAGVIRYRSWHNVKTPGEVHYEKIIKLPVSKGISTEEHFPVDSDTFHKSLHNDMRYIAKTRYVLHCGMKFEIDVFNDFSLIILECELNNLDEKIIFPDWLEKEIIAEITGMKEFSNYNMARTAAEDR